MKLEEKINKTENSRMHKQFHSQIMNFIEYNVATKKKKLKEKTSDSNNNVTR